MDPLQKPPKDWLSGLIPEGVWPAQRIDFFKLEFVPFLVSLMLFLVIVLSLIFVIVGAVMLMTSGGDKEGTAKAKNTITYALLGLALGLGSFIILGILGNFLGFNFLGITPAP